MSAQIIPIEPGRNYSAEDWRFPNDDERCICIGRTGSGKSQMLLFLLANASFDKRPWICIDYKGERNFFTMKRNKMFRGVLTPKSSIPKQPGIYWMRPREGIDDEDLDDFFFRVKRKGRIGLLFDECAWAPAGPGSGVRSILQQGRALRIPILAGNQRPVSLGDRNFLEQADHICAFNLVGDDDRKILRGYMPIDADQLRGMPEFCSLWYDVKKDRIYQLTPAPQSDYILREIADRNPRRLFDW